MFRDTKFHWNRPTEWPILKYLFDPKLEDGEAPHCDLGLVTVSSRSAITGLQVTLSPLSFFALQPLSISAERGYEYFLVIHPIGLLLLLSSLSQFLFYFYLFYLYLYVM